MTGRALFFSTFVVLGATAGALAQEAPAVPVLPLGTKVRVVATGGVIRGLLLQNDGSALQIAPEGGGMVQTVPFASVASLELAVDRRGSGKRGALIGAIAGVALSFVMPVDPATCQDPHSTSVCSRGQGLALGLFGGAGWGALVGSWIKTDQYRPIDISAFRSRPSRGSDAGRSFAVTLRF